MVWVFSCFIFVSIGFVQLEVINVWTRHSMQTECLKRDHFKTQVRCMVSAGFIFARIKVNEHLFCIILDSGSEAFWLADGNTQIGQWILPQYIVREQYKFLDTTPVNASDVGPPLFVSTLPQYTFDSTTELLLFDRRYAEEMYETTTLVNLTLHKYNSVCLLAHKGKPGSARCKQASVGSRIFRDIILARAKKISIYREMKPQPLGILGLNILSDNPEWDPVPNPNFLRQIQNQLPSFMFALKLKPDSQTGTFSLGEPILVEQNNDYVPIVLTGDDIKWIFTVKRIEVFIGKKWVTIKTKKIFIDTGAYPVIFPDRDYKQLVKNAKVKSFATQYDFSCADLEKMLGPVQLMIVVKMDNKDRNLLIDHIIRPVDQDMNKCKINIENQGNTDYITVGFPLFLSHYVEFHFMPLPRFSTSFLVSKKVVIY